MDSRNKKQTKENKMTYSRANRVRPVIEINTTYQAKQTAKREAQPDLVIKEVTDTQALTIIYTNKFRDILEFSNVNVSNQTLADLVAEYLKTPECDIKNHEVIKAYYKLENLAKYMIR
jgi:hypothetical protein